MGAFRVAGGLVGVGAVFLLVNALGGFSFERRFEGVIGCFGVCVSFFFLEGAVFFFVLGCWGGGFFSVFMVYVLDKFVKLVL